jgi:hypothetical protein
VAHPTRHEQRLARLEAQDVAGLEFQLDSALEGIDELTVAGVIMPPGRLSHAGDGRHHLGTHLAMARLRHPKVTIGEKRTTAWHERCGLGCGMAEFRGWLLCRLNGDRYVKSAIDGPRIGIMVAGTMTPFLPRCPPSTAAYQSP